MTEIRLGLIARCEIARGLAVVLKNFYDHMPVTKTLCVRMERPDCPERPDWYANRTEVTYSKHRDELDEEVVKNWLHGLDVVFTMETTYDWRVPFWCQELGVKLVIQGNPEFVRHGTPGRHGELPHPDQWWWPTTWRLPDLPPGLVMPVPMDRRPNRTRSDDDRLHLLHVIGKRAYRDRNGTELLIQAMRMVHTPVKLTVHGIDGDVAQFASRRNIELNLQLNPVEDLWTMYDDQDVLIIPRRYGGLCMPALEASAVGMVVAMTDTPPNQEFAAVRFPGTFQRRINMACGSLPLVEANPNHLAETIDMLADVRKRSLFGLWQEQQTHLLPTWKKWRPRYIEALENLV